MPGGIKKTGRPANCRDTVSNFAQRDTETEDDLAVLLLTEDDPNRPSVERMLEALELPALEALWRRTREAAAAARRAADIERVIMLTRGTKTLQRIANNRGLVLAVRQARRTD